MSTMDALKKRIRPSTMMIKMKGDKVSPSRMPREGEKGWDGTPLIRIEKKEEEVRLRI
jgi:hypothetical protein